MEFKYKKALNLLKRKEEFNKLKSSLNDKIPIICEKDPKSDIIEMEKTKFLVNPEMNVSKNLLYFSLLMVNMQLLEHNYFMKYMINIKMKMDFYILLIQMN